MEKIMYVTPIQYSFNATRARSHYFIDGAYKNRGEMCESIVKTRLNLYTKANPTTAWNKGSDIEEYQASVKSPKGTLAGNIDGTISEQIKAFFKFTPSSSFVWVDWNEKTGEVAEYWMNKREFGSFIARFSYISPASRTHKLVVRLPQSTTRRIKAWLNAQC